MYDEENKNLSENPDMENETGADVRDTENAGVEGKDSTARSLKAEPQAASNRYSGPFYQDTDYQQHGEPEYGEQFPGQRVEEAEEKEEFWSHHCEDRVHCAGIWRGGRSGIPGHEFCGTEAVRR